MIYRFAEFELDTDLQELRRGNRPVRLPPLPFAVLVHLIESRDRVVDRDELLERVWQRPHVSESAVPTCIRTLRTARPLGVGGPGASASAHGVCRKRLGPSGWKHYPPAA